MAPITIGIDARMRYYRAGGISTYVQYLSAALERIDHENDYTIFYSRKDVVASTGRFHRAVLWTPAHHRVESLALSFELLRYRLDVWHAVDFIPPYRGARRHVITIHDLNFLLFPQFLTPESRRYYNGQIQRAARTADHILTISEASKRDIVTHLSVAPSRITVHLCGVGSEFFPQPADVCERVRSELQLPQRYLLFVGTFEPRKNIRGLVTAYAELAAREPDLPSLVLAGRIGWLFDETMALISRLRLEERILFREFRRDQLPALYTMADLLLLPSFYEGFGLPALEAMACGTIPVVSDRSSLPEVVGDVGVLIDPDDPGSIAAGIRTGLADSAWRDKMRAAALQRARHFSWEQAAQIAMNVYKAVGQ
ncbi:MAG: glycosyltransferase family 4 protein [Anaerolinea sp.]|nr:glycosyltransferase family 4 protein [Anaerolinea sp.]